MHYLFGNAIEKLVETVFLYPELEQGKYVHYIVNV